MAIPEQIAWGVQGKGYDRDQQQCCVNAKELCQGYHKAREANDGSGAAPQTKHFYKELHAIHGRDLTSNPQTIVDPSWEPKTPAVNGEEEEEDGMGET